ncbi:alpha/beta hydrolase [Myxococcota bacterium]|nr:alpha/beta hydrolase [Myxococcota bacterium]
MRSPESLQRVAELAVRARKRAGAMVVDGFFRGLSSAGKLHPLARPERHDVEVIRDVPYLGTGRAEHTLDVYRSRKKKRPMPVVMYVHGGGFRILSKDSHWLMGLIFARRGYLVFNIGYRLAPTHPFPAAVEDTFDAFEWVVKNAASYGGDPSRIVLAGESAGGNLVTSLTVALTHRREEPHARRVFDLGVVPKTVVPACGYLQVSEPERFFDAERKVSRFILDRITEVSGAYLGRTYDPVLLELANPLLVLERDAVPDRPLPPFFVPCGTSDPLIIDSRRLKRALDRRGVPCAAPEYEGEHHAFHALIWKDSARRCWRETFEFLGAHVPGAEDV